MLVGSASLVTQALALGVAAVGVGSPCFAQVGASLHRPAECGGPDGASASNLWERAKVPRLRRYCDLIASGSAKLVGAGPLTKDVLPIAAEAESIFPERAAPLVLRARAHLRLGQPAEALAALERARRVDERALDEPVALLAWARANARAGRIPQAADAYRAALPQTDMLAAAERSSAALEAGLVIMASGRAAIDGAVAVLRQARRDTRDALHIAAVVALALALDRAGQPDDARAVLAERARIDTAAALGDERVVQALMESGLLHERDALLGTALALVDPPKAREAWKRYLAGPGGKGAWAEHAGRRELDGAGRTRSAGGAR